MNVFKSYSFELISRRSVRQVSSAIGWLRVGVGVPLVLTTAVLMYPFQMAHHLSHLQLVVTVFALWYVLFTGVYVINHWLAPHQCANDSDLQHLPLPPEQFLVHKMLDICLVPLISALLSLPFIATGLYYIGQPLQDWARADQGHDQGSWGLRALLLLVVLFSATLLILVIGLLAQEIISWIPGRIFVFMAAPAVIYFLTYLWRATFSGSYWESPQRIEPIAFVIPLVFVILFPFLIGVFNHSARKIFLTIVCTAIAVTTGFIMFPPQSGFVGILYPLEKLFDTYDQVIVYLVSHLNVLENIEIIAEAFNSSVVLNDDTVGNLIPQQIAAWVGTSILTPAAFFTCLFGLWLGTTLKHKIPRWMRQRKLARKRRVLRPAQ